MRKVLLPSLIIIAASLLVIRIFYLQVINDSFKLKSDNNAIKIKYDYPERGYIYDRNGKLLVANQASYDIMVIPREVKNTDTLEFCQLLNITKEDYFDEKFKITVANTDKYEEISRDFLIKPKAKGAKIPLPVPPFELNKSKLRYGAEDLLEGIQSTLVNNPDVKFEIICYPDNDKDVKMNQKLTDERCEALKEYLMANGVESLRFKTQGSATTDPLKPPPTAKMAKGKRYIGTSYIVVTDF